MRLFSVLAIAGCMALASACEGTIKESGYTFLQQNTSNETLVGKSRRDIRDMLGTPSAVSSVDAEKWYYISTITKDKSIFKRSIKEQNILEITFNEDGKALNYKEYTKDNAKSVSFDGSATHTAGNKVGIWEQLLGNIGRFPAANQPQNP